MRTKHFKIQAKVHYWYGIFFIRRKIYRKRVILGINVWFPVETKDFGPFSSYLSAYELIEKKGGEVYKFGTDIAI